MGFIPSFSHHVPSNPLGSAHAKARTLLYTILVVAECTLVIPLRRINKPIWRILKEDNYWVTWIFIIIVPVSFIAIMYAPQIQLISALYAGISLDLIDFTLIDWAIAISLGLIPIASLESYRLWLRKRGLFF